MDISRMQRGVLEDRNKWRDLYWLEYSSDHSLAIRQKVDDRMWYVKRDYMPGEIVLYGPYPSKEAIEMLMLMDAIDLNV
jgi:hypothetical protein